MKKVLIITIILCLSMLVACNNEATFIDEANFNVVLIDEQIKDYISKSRNNSSNINNYYQDIIVKTINNEFGYDKEIINSNDSYIGDTIYNLDLYEKELNILLKEDAVGIVKEALKKSNNYLLEEEIITTVCILPADPANFFISNQMKGVTGITYEKGKILILINPLTEDWKNTLNYTIAHEYHHSTWSTRQTRAGNKISFTVLDYLILEGRADSFAHMVYPNMNAPWVENLEDEKKIWEKIKPNLKNTDYTYMQKVIFGDYSEYPLWTGYKIGYSIVQTFLKNNPNISIEEWTDLSSDELLLMSGYE